MTPADIISQLQRFAELIGPNAYLQAAIIALAFVIAGTVASWIIARIIGRFARRSSNDFDDQIVALLHRPIFMSFVLLGLALATRRIGLPDATTFITIGILKTIAIFIWYNTLTQLMTQVVRVFSRKRDRKIVQTGMLSLLHNVMKVIAVALTV